MPRLRAMRTSGRVFVLAAAAAAGCGGVTAATPDGGGDAHVVTIDEACGMVAQGICDALNRCAPIFFQEQYGDATTCVSRQTLSCKTDQMVSGVARTADDLVACAQAVPGLSCPDALASNLPAACQPKPGTVANGAVCGSDLQCQSTFCNKTDKCGVCAARGAAGKSCTTDNGCVTGLVCAGQAGSKVCVTPGGMGQTCNLPNQPCRADLYCTSANGPGTCAARAEAGGACDSNDACNFFKGNLCNTSDHTCFTISIAKGGEQCGLLSKTACVGGVGPCSNIISGVCANPAQDGEACGGNAVCIPPATCVNKLCQLPSAPDCH
ncbi:MAG TPA: hypothetical protein VHK47_10620 [Polyangia bacterium]|nr:hypothetical protein [Polyangia bacterium]